MSATCARSRGRPAATSRSRSGSRRGARSPCGAPRRHARWSRGATSAFPRTCATSASTCSRIASSSTRAPGAPRAARRPRGSSARSSIRCPCRSEPGGAARRVAAPPHAAAAHAPPDARRLALRGDHLLRRLRRAQHRQQPALSRALADALVPGALGRALRVGAAGDRGAPAPPGGALRPRRRAGRPRDREPAAPHRGLRRGGRGPGARARRARARGRTRLRAAHRAGRARAAQLPLPAGRARRDPLRGLLRLHALPVRPLQQVVDDRVAAAGAGLPRGRGGRRPAAPRLHHRGGRAPRRPRRRGRRGERPARVRARRSAAPRPLAVVAAARGARRARGAQPPARRGRGPLAHGRPGGRRALRARGRLGGLGGGGVPRRREPGRAAHRPRAARRPRRLGAAGAPAGLPRAGRAGPVVRPGLRRAAARGGHRVSRRVFRGAVAAPRPTSAWVLVSVASASLWITGQLDRGAIAAQVLALAFSFLRRGRPFAWQRSPVSLNVGMLAIVAETIAVALRGAPSTVALAHFAALTQGLQLLDARPRSTEYLLVALALFQVILASNLTDSVFFPPLLVAFLLAAVWTLLVHTLRSEAIEAGDPGAVTRAITPGLLRTTLLASGVSVLLALALFVALPRLRSNVVSGPGIGRAFAAAGFSSRVELGDLGRIRGDPAIAMRIETLRGALPAPTERYWRGLAFDRFDGTAWSITPPGRLPVAGSPEGGVAFGPRPKVVNLVQRIVREPVEAGVLFA